MTTTTDTDARAAAIAAWQAARQRLADLEQRAREILGPLHDEIEAARLAEWQARHADDMPDQLGNCETCGVHVFSGDRGGHDVNGYLTCEEHTAKLSDMVKQYRDVIAAGAWSDLGHEAEARGREVLAALEADIASNGDRSLAHTL
jgi:hypothetical protein